MISTPRTSAPSLRRRLVVLAASAALLIALMAGAITWLGGGFQQRTVADMLASSGASNTVEATPTLCGDVGCVEGWNTDLGAYLRFRSEGEAEHWATVLGDDGRRWKNFVLDMTEKDLPLEQRRQAVDILFSWHDWS